MVAASDGRDVRFIYFGFEDKGEEGAVETGVIEGTVCGRGKSVRGLRWEEGQELVRVAVGTIDEEEEGKKKVRRRDGDRLHIFLMFPARPLTQPLAAVYLAGVREL